MEGPSAPDRSLATGVHRRDLGEDQYGALRGWGIKGRRLKAYTPHGHWKTLTFIAALRCDRIDAPSVIDGPINGETFLLYIEKILAPPSRRAMSSSWTTSAATKARPPAPSSEPKALTSSSCRPTAPISIPSNRSSPSSNISSEKLSRVTSKPPGERLASSSTSSVPPSAPTTSSTPATVPSK